MEVNTKFTSLAKFQSKQLDAWNTLFNSQCKYLLYGGAAGGGKSYYLRWAALGLGMYYAFKYKIKGVAIGLFSEDYPTLRDRQVARIKMEFPSWLGELRETRDEGFVFRAKEDYGGFFILLRNLDDPSKYASTEFAAELVEELTKNPVQTFEDLKFRLRYPGISDVKFVGATNPGGIGHSWVKKLWIEPDPNNPDLEYDKYFFVPATVYDNKYIDPDYVTQLKSLPDQKRKAWLEGSWDVFEGQVFSEWNKSAHVIQPFKVPSDWKKYIAIDWGVNAPFSVGWYAQDYGGRSYLYRELYMTGQDFERKFKTALTPKRLATTIVNICKKNNEDYEYCVCDPSMWNKLIITGESNKPEGESIAEIMIRQGLKLMRGDNDRLNGLNRYREALALAPDGKPYYRVFSSCFDTIRTIPALVYDTVRIEDVDTDGEDHCYDRDRYYFMSRPVKSQQMQREVKTKIQRQLEYAKRKYEKEQEAEWGEPAALQW